MINCKPTYTVSQIEAYFHCQKEYELRYLRAINPVRPHTPGLGPQTLIPAAQWGTLVHEVLQFLDTSMMTNIETVIDQALINQQISDADGSIKKKLHHFLQSLQNSEQIWNLISNLSEDKSELPFLLDAGLYFLKGTWDRIGQKDEQWIIVDYKTDLIRNEKDLALREKHYNPQLACYALALMHAKKIDVVTTFLLFTDGPFLIEKKWSLDDLTSYRKLLDAFHDNHFKNDISYLLTTNTDSCPTCPYYPLNYCGVKSLI